MRKAERIRAIPLFNCLNPQELERLTGLFRELSFRKGDTICREGEEGDTLYLLLSGQLDVWAGTAPARLINRMVPGDFFGEITILSGGKRSATVGVSRDAKVLALERKPFEVHFLHHPKILEYLSKVMAKRLVSVTHGEVLPKPTSGINVVGAPEATGKTLTASALAAFLREFSGRDTLHVEIVSAEKDARRNSAAGWCPPKTMAMKGDSIRKHRVYRRATRWPLIPHPAENEMEGGVPNTFNIIMHSIQALQYELGNFKAISADVRINPDLRGFTWIDFHKAMDIVRKGEEAAEHALPEIRRTLAERLRNNPAMNRITQ